MTAITETNFFLDYTPQFKDVCTCCVPDNVVFFFVFKSNLLNIIHIYGKKKKKMISLWNLLFRCKLSIMMNVCHYQRVI